MNDEDPPCDVMRSAEAIARRAIILSQVVSVAYGAPRSEALAWLKREGLLSELSPREQDFLRSCDPSQEDVIAFSWCIERLAPLLWSIMKVDRLPPLSAQCDTYALKDAVVWPPASTYQFIASAELRDEELIREEYEKIYDAHWRVRDAQVFGRPIPEGHEAGAIYERHYGFNWLIGYCGQEWDEISTDT